MRKKSFLSCLVAVALFGMCACSPQNPPSSNAAPADNAAPAANPAPAAAEAVPTTGDTVPGEGTVEGVPTEIPIVGAPSDIPAPEDVAAPPSDALKTASGVSYKILTPAPEGAKKVSGSQDQVKVNYTGWTTDGKMFDSSVVRGEPAMFVLSQVIPGWTEGLQVMSVGEKVRFWIPEELAYKGQQGAPAGMLVFDVDLLDVNYGPKAPENVAAAPENAIKTESGLQYITVKPGDGKTKPTINDIAKVHFTVWSRDGKMFDTSMFSEVPLMFPVSEIIDGWKELVQLMSKGEKVISWIPEKLMFAGRRGPQGDLTVEMELVEVIVPPAAPADVAEPPANAEKTASGLASKVLKAGTGTAKPTATSRVKVNYSGWTTNGQLFDSTVIHGGPIELELAMVIPGWTEGLQLMVEGESRRFWIPEELAYKGQPGAPAGMLVFDIELIKILD